MSDAYAMWLEQAAFQYSELLIEFRDIAEKCCVEHRCDAYPDEFDPRNLLTLLLVFSNFSQIVFTENVLAFTLKRNLN